MSAFDARIDSYLEAQQLIGDVQRVVALTGDASDRRYFRVHFTASPSIVLALHAGPIDVTTLPFVSVARLMKAIPLPVPEILHWSNELGVLGLEDLGDVTLQAHLGVTSRNQHAALYRQAVEFIAVLQQRGAVLASPAYPPYGVAFDVEKLTRELEYVTKHYLGAYRGLELSADQREALHAEWAILAGELAAEPRVLCHRDYHSRNLMWHAASLYIIDFQDARMGPDTYDLASLLRDSYVDLPPSQVDELIAYFVALTRGPHRRDADERREFQRRFDLMALQRNLKALGTFGYQTTTRGNPVYIQYMPRTLSYVSSTLGRYPRFGRLQEILATLVAELQ
jgi:aminoglycoside/choline kinase family phosphotransferase